jgi:uncharacterized protein
MDLKTMLGMNSWAVVGDVLNAEKYAYRILKRLQERGYYVQGVHPRGGDGIYRALTELGTVPEVMCLVINPATGKGFVHEAKQLGVKAVWLQPGADTDEVTAACDEAGLPYVKACVLVETSRN